MSCRWHGDHFRFLLLLATGSPSAFLCPAEHARESRVAQLENFHILINELEIQTLYSVAKSLEDRKMIAGQIANRMGARRCRSATDAGPRRY